MIYFRNIRNDYDSYNYLIHFYQQNKDKAYQKIEISFRDVKWIAANTCSMMGAIFQELQDSFNTITFWEMNRELNNILMRNGFLAFLGYNRIYDSKHTTIQYLKLSPRDSRFFTDYIRSHLLGKEAMPTMTDRLKKRITEGIYEIFLNAAMHSETQKGIFTCGQFFPTKNKIEFMITDMGIGIKNRVNRYLDASLSAVDAIEWAMEERNTTKPNDSGGLGLAILKQFIALNKGRIQIISNDGYWEFSEKSINKRFFSGEFPGTAVNICINTNDPVLYKLTEDIIDDDEIF